MATRSRSRFAWRRLALLAAACLALIQTAAAEDAGPPPVGYCPAQQLTPFSARYDVYLNGRLLGRSEASLKKSGAQWTYRVSTEANRGLAGFLGGKITERSQFELADDGSLLSRDYDYQQGIRFSRREGRARFDWDRLQVEGVYKKKDFMLPLVAGQTDRMLINLKLMRQLAEGQQQFAFETVERGNVRQHTYSRTDEVTVTDTSEGELQTVLVNRHHSNPRRQTRSWHAPKLGFLPVRLEQIDGDDDEVIEMRLTEWVCEPCPSVGP
ncbi:MAG: DUF3108 domain-containing protein [Pseudomonadota bacterium]